MQKSLQRRVCRTCNTKIAKVFPGNARQSCFFAAPPTKEMAGPVYGTITIATAYITSVAFILAICAIASPYLWYAKTNDQAFGLQYSCANNVMATHGNTNWQCHEHPNKLPAGDLKDETAFCIGIFWGSMALLMVSTIHLTYGCVTKCLSSPGMFVNSMLQLISAVMFIVVMLVVLGVINIDLDIDSIKTTKEAADGSWSFSYYATWVVIGLELLNSLLIAVAAMTESGAPVAAAATYSAATYSDSKYDAPAPASQKGPSVAMYPPSQAPLRTAPQMDDNRSCRC